MASNVTTCTMAGCPRPVYQRQLCVNPRHLRWATRIENMADKVLDGTDPGRIRRRQRTNQQPPR